MGLSFFDPKLHPWAETIAWLLVLVVVIFVLAFAKELLRILLHNLTSGGTKERTVGVVSLIAAGLLAWVCFSAVQSARSGAPKVSSNLLSAILCPVTLIIGVIQVILGPRTRSLMGTRENPTLAAYVIWFGALVLGVILYICIRGTLQAEGYDFHGRL